MYLYLSLSLAGCIHLHNYIFSSGSSSEAGAPVQLICCTQLRAPAQWHSSAEERDCFCRKIEPVCFRRRLHQFVVQKAQ